MNTSNPIAQSPSAVQWMDKMEKELQKLEDYLNYDTPTAYWWLTEEDEDEPLLPSLESAIQSLDNRKDARLDAHWNLTECFDWADKILDSLCMSVEEVDDEIKNDETFGNPL